MWMALALVGSALFSLVGSFISAQATKSVSDAELDLQRETNAQNQQNFETELKYNSVGEQISQQRLAGVNPDLQDSQPTQTSGALPDLQSPDLSQLASGLSNSILVASQQLSSLCMQSFDVASKELDLQNAKTRNKLSNLLLGTGNYNFVVDDIANSVDPSWFESRGLSPDSSDADFASFYDSSPDLTFVSPDEFDGGVLNSSAVSSSLFDESHYKLLGFDDKQSRDLAALARSVSKSPDMQRRVYDRSAQLYRSRRGYDFEDNNPFNRSSVCDVPSAFLAYCQNYADNVFLELENFLKNNQDISKMFGLTDKYDLDDLSVHASSLQFQGQIKQLSELIKNGYYESSADVMRSSIDLMDISNQLDLVAKKASYSTIRNGLNSPNMWSRFMSLYQLNQLGTGQTFPLSFISQGVTDVLNESFSGIGFLRSLQSLGIISGDSKLLNLGESFFNLDIDTPEKWDSFVNLFK